MALTVSQPSSVSSNAGSAPVVVQANPDGAPISVPSDTIFGAQFFRAGPDLRIEGDGETPLLVIDYFTTTPANLVTPNGAVLRADLVERLAGPEAPGQYAQQGAATPAVPIGQVETLNGAAAVMRTDGTREPLTPETKIFLGDLLETEDGATVSVTFLDGTIFTLASASRMVIDELIYSPESTENSGTFNLIQGGFVFIAGQVAKTGGMDIETPAATMGIRGTTGIIQVISENGVVTLEVSLARDPDGSLGQINVFNLEGELIAEIVNTESKWVISPDQGIAQEVPRTAEDDANDAPLVDQAVEAFVSAINRVDAGGDFVPLVTPNNSQNDTPQAPPPIADQSTPPIGPDTAPASGGPTPSPPPAGTPQTTQPSEDLEEGSIQPPEITITPVLVAAQEDSEDGVSGTIPTDAEDPVFSLLQGPENGTVELAANGDFIYSPDPDFNGSDQFFYSVSGDNADSQTGTVFIEVAAVNDAPLLSDANVETDEDTALALALEGDDVDGDTLTYALASGPENGAATVGTDGQVTYMPSENFSGSDSFVVMVQDPDGAMTEATITIAIAEVNDAPVFSSPASAFNGALIEDEGSQVASSQVTASDVDPDPTLTFSGGAETALGEFFVAEDGTWRFELDTVAAQSLAEGQQVVESTQVTVSDGLGGTDTETITVTITGRNDAPAVTSDDQDAAGALVEDGEVTEVGGQLLATDPDTGAVLTWSGGEETPLGAFSITDGGLWSYVLDTAAAQSLAEGQVVVETTEVTVSDGLGGTDTETLTVTITGTNDFPAVSSGDADARGGVEEDGEVISTGGTLSATDPDSGATLTWSGGETTALGVFAITAAGVWTYTLTADAAQSLAQGQQVVETTEVTVSDGLGGTDTQILTVTIAGSNDAPSVTSDDADARGALAEDGEVTEVDGQLAATDPDTGAVLTWSGGEKTALGEFTISQSGFWQYQLDTAAAQSLAEGEEVVETTEVTVSDGLGGTDTETLTVTITGRNDAPTVTSGVEATTGALTEDGDETSIGDALSAEDVDKAAVLTWSGGEETALGEFSITEDGIWTYVLDSAAAQSLAEGQEVVETTEVFVSDGLGGSASQILSVTITGSNDAPAVTSSAADATGAVSEGGPTNVASGTLTAVDPDTGAALTWSGGGNSNLGALAITEDGVWTYTADLEALEGLAEGEEIVETFDVSVSDGLGGQATETIEITLTGENDAPVFDDVEITADAGTFVTGTLVAEDADGDELSYGVASLPANGIASVASDGSFLYLPFPGFVGADVFEVTVTDESGVTTTATVTVLLVGEGLEALSPTAAASLTELSGVESIPPVPADPAVEGSPLDTSEEASIKALLSDTFDTDSPPETGQDTQSGTPAEPTAGAGDSLTGAGLAVIADADDDAAANLPPTA